MDITAHTIQIYRCISKAIGCFWLFRDFTCIGFDPFTGLTSTSHSHATVNQT